MSKHNRTWGGARAGAGRPVGSGKGPNPNSRRKRVAVMLSDTEFMQLQEAALRGNIPPSTIAYNFVIEGLSK